MRTERLIIAVATLLMVALTARLGFWQLDRAAQKTDLQSLQDQRRQSAAVTPATLARTPEEAATQWHRPVELTGHWASAATVFLENRQMEGRPGFYVVTAFRLEDGSAVAVQRGWEPRDPRDRTKALSPPVPEGLVRLSGRIAPPPARLYDLGEVAAGPIRHNLDLSSWASETGLALRPLSVMQLGPDGPDDPLQRNWPVPVADVHKHYGYALQWFALSALLVGLYVWFQILRPRRTLRSA